MSATSATGADLRHLVHVGEHRNAGLLLHRGQDAQPFRSPGPRKDLPLVRLALSKLHLKTSGTPSRSAGRARAARGAAPCSSVSMTSGPAMTKQRLAFARP